MCNYEDSQPTLYRVREIKKSRKEHKCSECKQIIAVHSRYTSFAGIWDHEFSHFNACQQCGDVIEFCNHANIPYCHGQLHSCVTDYLVFHEQPKQLIKSGKIYRLISL